MAAAPSAFAPIDIYCERLGPDFWAEPVNALSNLAFIASAVMLGVLARRQAVVSGKSVPWASRLLIALVATIGVGSFLFHTLAVTWALWADVLPIFIYQLVFVCVYTRQVGRAPWWGVALAVAGFFGASQGFAMLPERWLNGSLSYAPALLFVLGLGVWHWRSRRHEPAVLLAAAGVFAVSLSLRSMDMLACDATGIGTHFLWHTLNGIVLYLSTRAFLMNVLPGR